MIKLIYHQKIHHHIKILPRLCINNKTNVYKMIILNISDMFQLKVII